MDERHGRVVRAELALMILRAAVLTASGRVAFDREDDLKAAIVRFEGVSEVIDCVRLVLALGDVQVCSAVPQLVTGESGENGEDDVPIEFCFGSVHMFLMFRTNGYDYSSFIKSVNRLF